MMTKLMYAIHRILGTLLSILFLMWFLSGIVMIYHTFPRVSSKDKMSKLEALPHDLPGIEEILMRVPHTYHIRGLCVSKYLGETIFEIQTDKGTLSFPADSTHTLASVNAERLAQVAALWCDAPVASVDTLCKLDQWIPFGQLKKHLPIYKYHFTDDDETELYLSSVTGEVLQYTNRYKRFWAWMGAIPHWVYFTRLRQDADLWKQTVVWMSAIGCIMTLAGIYVGIHAYYKARRKRGTWQSPYRKRWYWWHHVTGIVFGVFVLTWVFSGMMSLADVPEWIGPVRQEYPVRRVMNEAQPQLDSYPLDYRKVIACSNEPVTRLEWGYFRSLPLYHIQMGNKKQSIDASVADSVQILSLTEAQVTEAVRAIHGDDAFVTTQLMTEYDDYYLARSGHLALPVWKVSVDNADRTCYYINPSNGAYREYNTHRRWGFWMYNGLHSLRIRFLINHPMLWTTVMWTLLAGGAVVSLTGVVLGVNYIRRLFRRWLSSMRRK